MIRHDSGKVEYMEAAIRTKGFLLDDDGIMKAIKMVYDKTDDM